MLWDYTKAEMLTSGKISSLLAQQAQEQMAERNWTLDSEECLL